MAFDLSTATPVQPNVLSNQGGFDLFSAQPVTTTGGGAALITPKQRATPSTPEQKERVQSISEKLGEYFFEPPTREDFSLGELGTGAGLGSVAGVVAPPVLKVGGKLVSKLPFPGSSVVGSGMTAAGKYLSETPLLKRAATGAVGGAVGEGLEQTGEYFGVPRAITMPLSFTGSGLAMSLLGGETRRAREAEKALAESVGKTGEETKTAITQKAKGETQAEYEKRARQQFGLKTAEQKFQTEAQKKSEDSAREFSGLGKPNKVAELGDEMQRRITGTEFTRGSRRQQRASEDFKNYFKQAEGFENSNPRKIMLARLEKMSSDPAVGSAGRAYATQALKDLEQSQNAIGAELEFRKYFEQASAPQKEGFTAVQQDANRKVSEIIGEALNTHAPLREKARGNYKEFSTPLDAYETLFGKKGVAIESGVPGRVKMMPTDYPNTYFKNRDTLNALREQLAGDEAAVRKFATQHVVNELEGKTAKESADWLKNNSGWVNEVEGLNTRVNRYVQKLAENEQKAKKLFESAEKLSAKAKEIGTVRETTESKIAQNAADQKEKIDEFKKLLNVNPKQARGIADNMVNYLSKYKMLPESKIKLLQEDIEKVDKTAAQAQKASEIRKLFVKYGVISAGLPFGAYTIGKTFLKD